MAPKKKEKIKKELKSSFSTGIMVFFIVLIIAIAAFVASLYAYSYRSLGKVVFPNSPLTKVKNSETSYIEDPNLNTPIQCPNIPVMMNVGGVERGVTDHGALYRYSDGLTISIYELDGSVEDLMNGDFAYNLYAGQLSGYPSYVSEPLSMDIGYFNGYPAEYQCGTISLISMNDTVTRKSNRDIYVTSLVLDLGMPYKPCICVSTDSPKNLYDAGVLQEAIGYTVMDISQTAAGKQYANVVEDTTEDTTVSEVTPTPTPAPVNINQTLDLQVKLLENYDDGAIIKLTFANGDKDLSPVMVFDKSGEVAGTYIENTVPGIAFYRLFEGKMGTYYLQLPSDLDIGQYTVTVMHNNDYMNEYGATEVGAGEITSPGDVSANVTPNAATSLPATDNSVVAP